MTAWGGQSKEKIYRYSETRLFTEEKVIHNDMKRTRTVLITWGFARFITFASVSIFYPHIFLCSVLFYRLWYV